MKDKLVLIIGFIILYLFFFNPLISFFPIAPLKCMYPVAFVLFFKYKKNMKIKQHTKKELKIWAIITLWTLVVPFFNGYDPVKMGVFPLSFFSLFEIIVIPYIFARVLQEFISPETFKKYIAIIVFFAAFITILCLFNSGFNNWIKHSVCQYDQDNLLSIIEFRGFGLADNLFFSYACLMGYAFSYALFQKEKYWLFFMAMCLIAISVNARTGFVPVVVSLIVSMSHYKSRMIQFIMFGVIVAFIALSFWDFSSFQNTIDFVVNGFDQSVDLANGEISGSMGGLFSEELAKPYDLQGWILGYGINIYDSKYYSGVRTDVGYLQQIYYGGLVYVILLALFVYGLYKKIKPMHWEFAVVFFISVLITNWKGISIGSNTVFKCVMLCYYYYYTLNNTILGKEINQRI